MRRFRAACVLLTLVGVAFFALLTFEAVPSAGEGDDQVLARNVAAPLLQAPTPASQPALRHLGEGRASFYGPGFEGNRTANGEIFRMQRLTAAHRTLPFGSRVRVTNLRNGESVVVRINDRGPFVGNRVIDLSRGAAQEIGMIRSGTAPVRLELLTQESGA
ncbi:MAG: septal ring lytic transglycosylase RlpA family protein [Bacteroidota bacterium]